MHENVIFYSNFQTCVENKCDKKCDKNVTKSDKNVTKMCQKLKKLTLDVYGAYGDPEWNI